MVRLFIPEGEGQHPLARRIPDPLPTSLKHVQTPFMNVVGGAAITAFLALVGRSRPGTFLKSTAYLSAATTSYAALDTYGRREVNRAIFKLDNVEPKPAKLWEKTKRWSVDDVVLGGGILGTFLALNPRALPGVGGWKRLLGAATVGCAAGGYVAAAVIVPIPGLMNMAYETSVLVQDTHYARLKEDVKAQEALSRFGKLAFSYYTSPLRALSINPYKSVSQAGMHVTAGGAAPVFAGDPHAGFSQPEADLHLYISIDFGKGELDGPDIEYGYRAYKDSLSKRDKGDLQDWLERLQEMQKEKSLESQYLWYYLTFKENKFYKMQAEDREKDLFRRELQLLNSMATDTSLRVAVLDYHIFDALKRLEEHETDEGSVSRNALAEKKQAPETLPPNQMVNYSPQSIVDRVREIWSNQKQVVGILEQSSAMHKDLQFEPGSPQEAHFEKVRENYEMMKLNTEATERLLAEFEDLVRAAEEDKIKLKSSGA